MIVYVATHTDKHGFDETRVFRTSASADAWRIKVAKDEWPISCFDMRMPEDDSWMAQTFWDIAHDVGDMRFCITQCEIED